MSHENLAPSPQGATAKLPLLATVDAAYAAVLRNVSQALRISWVAGLVISGIAALWETLVKLWAPSWLPSDTGDFWPDLQSLPIYALLMVALTFLPLPFIAAIAVGWHRFILRGEMPGSLCGLAIDRRIWRYTGLGVLLAVRGVLVAVVPGMTVGLAGIGLIVLANVILPMRTALVSTNTLWIPAVAAPILSAGLILVLGPYALARQMLLLPAMAIGNDAVNRRAALSATQGNYWRLLAGLLMSTLPLFLATTLIGFALALPATGPAANAIWLFDLIVPVLATLTGAGFLSLAYRHFFEPDTVLPA